MSANTGFMSLREAAKRLGVHESTVRRYADRGLVGAVRLPSGVRRVRSADVERLGAPADDEHLYTEPTKTIEELIAEQGVRPIADLSELAVPDLWRTDEEAEQFLTITRAERDRDR